MKKTILFFIFLLMITSGCEMTIGIPRSTPSNPKEVKPVNIEAVEGRTPLELLQTGEKNVQTVYYTNWGYYVTQIGKVQNEAEQGPQGRYWVLYVDGKPVKEGTDRMRLKGSEKVEFRFEKPA